MSARYVVTASATGVRHAMTVEARDTTNVAVCGSSATMPSTEALEAPGVEALGAAVTLNDLYLEGITRVCGPCRAKVSIAALNTDPKES